MSSRAMRSVWRRISSGSVRSLLERPLATLAPPHVRLGRDRPIVLARAEPTDPRAGVRTEPSREHVVVRVRQLIDGADAKLTELGRGPRADAPQRVDRPVAHHDRPLLAGEPEDASALGERAGELGTMPRIPDADRAPQAGALQHGSLHVARERLRVVGLDGHEGLVPAHDLHHGRELAERLHHVLARLEVVVAVDGQEDAFGAPLQGRAQGHARAHAERSRLVRRRGDDPALRRVAVTPDDDGSAPQLRMSQHLDGGDELVHVDMEEPSHALDRLRSSPSLVTATACRMKEGRPTAPATSGAPSR